MQTYFGTIKTAIKTTLSGARLTFKHIRNAISKQHKPFSPEMPEYFKQNEGIVTLQYPHEKLPLPDNARYQLHNEIDDCIVCDKCAKICPVDCIDIEVVKATEQIGTTSDGTPIRLYAAKFDIDMAKCCFCGLCTTVCPTECLTMTQEYDVSVFDMAAMNFPFAVMTEQEIADKKRIYEIHQQQKESIEKEKLRVIAENKASESPKIENNTSENETKSDNPIAETPKARPVFRPKMK